MWHFHRYTSHLPKLACITLSHEQLNRVGGWQCTLGGRQTDSVFRWGGGGQVLAGWSGTGGDFKEGTAGAEEG